MEPLLNPRDAAALRLLLAALVLAQATGCATITGSETQSISLQAVDASGEAVAEAECQLSNDRGKWRAKPPAVAAVTRSAGDLMVQCEAERRQPGIVRAISRVNAGMFGNIIFGGGIGAIIDHSKGTAYDYPAMLRVIFGMTQVIDRQNEDAGTPATAPATPPATSAASNQPPR